MESPQFPAFHNPSPGLSLPGRAEMKESPNSKQDSVKGGFFFPSINMNESMSSGHCRILGSVTQFGSAQRELNFGSSTGGGCWPQALHLHLDIWGAPGGNGGARTVPHPSCFPSDQLCAHSEPRARSCPKCPCPSHRRSRATSNWESELGRDGSYTASAQI